MKIITEKFSLAELNEMAQKMYGNLVKAVVDVRLGTMAADMELHADGEAALMESGSRQEDLWGINLYPELDPKGPDFIEFDSLINIRPRQSNRSRGVEDPKLREKISTIVGRLVS